MSIRVLSYGGNLTSRMPQNFQRERVTEIFSGKMLTIKHRLTRRGLYAVVLCT